LINEMIGAIINREDQNGEEWDIPGNLSQILSIFGLIPMPI